MRAAHYRCFQPMDDSISVTLALYETKLAHQTKRNIFNSQQQNINRNIAI